MNRDCNKCVYHTSGSCSQWECKGTTQMTEVKYNLFGGKLIVKYDEKGITMITREALEALLETKTSYAELRYQQGRADREKELAELPNEYSEKLWKNAYNRGRAKAIDEFKSKLLSDEFQKYALDDVFETCRMYNYSGCIDAFIEYVEIIAEQMKGDIE